MIKRLLKKLLAPIVREVVEEQTELLRILLKRVQDAEETSLAISKTKWLTVLSTFFISPLSNPSCASLKLKGCNTEIKGWLGDTLCIIWSTFNNSTKLKSESWANSASLTRLLFIITKIEIRHRKISNYFPRLVRPTARKIVAVRNRLGKHLKTF